MNDAVENDLIALVHQGVVDPDGWAPLVAALRASMAADHANLTFRRTDAPMSDLTSFASGGPTEDMSRFYTGSYHRTDPLPYYRLVPGHPYDLDDLFGAGEQELRTQLNLLLAPFGDPHLMIVRIAGPGGANAWLTVLREQPPFTVADRGLFRRLSQHLAIALQAFSRLADAQTRLAAYGKAMDRLNVGIVTLAGDGHIIDADPIVSGLLARGALMRRDPQGRLALTDSAANRALSLALRDFTAEPAGRPRAVRLSEEHRADMLLLPVADRPVTGRYTPVLRAYVHIDQKPAGDSIDSLVEMFRLTRSEARLALALGEGLTLAEAAERLGITLQTARTYSKRIFQKTGTRRQAELVRTLLTSTLSLA